MAEPRTPPSAPDPDPEGGSPQRLALLVVAGLVVVAVIVAVGLVAVTGGDDDEGDGGEAADQTAASCLVELAQMLPADVISIEAADLAAARQNGYDDSSVQSMSDSSLAMGAGPDPLTRRVVLRDLRSDFEGLPYDPSDVDCWIDASGTFLVRGSFDRDRFESSEFGGDLVLSDDEQVVASDASLLSGGGSDGGSGDAALLVEAVEALGSDVVMSRLILGRIGGEDGGAWIGSSLSKPGPTWTVTTVWVYDDPAIAEAAEPQLRELLANESALRVVVEGDPSTILTRDGGVVRVQAPLATDAGDWYTLLNRLDPILLFDPR